MEASSCSLRGRKSLIGARPVRKRAVEPTGQGRKGDALGRKASRNGRNGSSADRVHVGLLVDESGSMTPNHEAVVSGINGFVESLREHEVDAVVLATLSMFDLNGSEPIVRPKF